MAILTTARRALIGEPITIPAAFVSRFPELGRARYRRGGLPPRIGGWALGQRTAAAITLWRTIWLGADTPMDPELLLHELRHVEQFGESVTFPLRYLWESVLRGYSRNRFELDARRYATQKLAAPEPFTRDV